MSAWIKMSDRTPSKNGEYFCAVDNYVVILFWEYGHFTTNGCPACNEVYRNDNIKAYMPLVMPKYNES